MMENYATSGGGGGGQQQQNQPLPPPELQDLQMGRSRRG